jgi:hypothetical protein
MQLGLPVVSRITQQWNIEVTLAAGESGGIRAEVSIPSDLLREAEIERSAPVGVSSARGTLSGATALLADPVETRTQTRPEPPRPRAETVEQEPLETSSVGLPVRRRGASAVGRALDEEKKAQSGSANDNTGTRRSPGGGGAMGFVSGRQNHSSDTGEG